MQATSRVGAVAITTLLFVSHAFAAPCTSVDCARNLALAWLISHQQADGSWKDASGGEVAATSEALAALRGAGIIKSYPYVKGLTWLGNADVSSTDSLARKVIALNAAGMDVSADVNKMMQWKNAPNHASWGAYDHLSTSFPDTPLALKALRLSGYSYPGQSGELYRTVFCDIYWSSPFRDPSDTFNYGGIPYLRMPESVDPLLISTYKPAMLPSVLSFTEIAAIKAENASWNTAGQACDENRQVWIGGAYQAWTIVATAPLTDFMNGVANYVVNKKNADGGFGGDIGGASNIFDTALASAVVDYYSPTSATAAGIKTYFINNQAADGSWNGSAFLTAVVVNALPLSTLTDTDSDGIPDAIETILGTNPVVFDSRYLAN